MHEIEQYAVEPLAGTGRGRLVDARTSKPVMELDGTLLEAQYALDDGCKLLWLVEDSPYDGALHVHLLDAHDRLIDSLFAGVVFVAGILQIRVVGDTSMDVEFFRNDVVYQVAVEPVARLHVRLPAGWRYRYLLRRHRLMVTQKEM